LAVKQGRRGDGYSVGHWSFLLIDDLEYELDDPSRLVWVHYASKHPDRESRSGQFLFDTRRGVVSISREWPSGEIVEVLVSGRGFLAERGACK
jgi:hypothetical protein